MVDVEPPYSMIDELNSLMQVIQLRIAPESMPGSISRAMTVKNVFIGDTPKLIDASSMLGSVW
ncbi:MAG: hypothetical protein BWY81_00626 [Firmicutes bacterium ADurb.Bin467]|nr:MAG: hypothetical protein BWY81_00626 [Firmicutes bacterium ADurb.Bin467]